MSVGILFESKEWSSYALEKHINDMGVAAKLIDMQEDFDLNELLSYNLIVNRVFASAVFRGHQKTLERMPEVIGLLKENDVPMINPYEAHFYEISKRHATETLAAHGFAVPLVYGVFTPSQVRSNRQHVYANTPSIQNHRLAPGIRSCGQHEYTKISHTQSHWLSSPIVASGQHECSKTPLAPSRRLSSPLGADNQLEFEYPCIVKPDCGGRTNYTFIVNSPEELIRCMENVPDIQFIAEEYIYPEYGFTTRIEVINRSCALILKRSVAENGLSAYHLGSTYAAYDDCSDNIKSTVVRAMDLLQIEVGSVDIIENQTGFYIIDINSVSNASEDNIEMFSFDLIKETAAYIVMKHQLPMSPPLDYSALSSEQFNAEIKKGITSLNEGRVIPSEQVRKKCKGRT